MDLKTLWERTNDAIDTIIRRDESTETESGDLLQPCIEGNLGVRFPLVFVLQSSYLSCTRQSLYWEEGMKGCSYSGLLAKKGFTKSKA
ncbi:hypothetical protein ACLOJK_020203 [Asimina triloba]